jgi:hypothetical protein
MMYDQFPYVARSCDGAQTFGAGVQVTDKPACCSSEKQVGLVADSDGWLAVVWKDSANTLGLAESRDGGTTFLPMTLLSGPGWRYHPTVTMDARKSLYIAWEDSRHSSDRDIYFCKAELDPTAAAPAMAVDEYPHAGELVAKPNPFYARTVIMLGPAEAGQPLEIYDVCGRLLKRIAGPGRAREWDGYSDEGVRVAPGIYLALVRGPRGGPAARLVMIR